MDYTSLKSELVSDPVTLGYVGKTDQQAADFLNSITTGRKKLRDNIPTYLILDATDHAEYTALSAAFKTQYQIIVSVGSFSIKSTNIKNMLLAMFGVGTTTRTNLIALQNEVASRAEELGFGPVLYWDISRARAL